MQGQNSRLTFTASLARFQEGVLEYASEPKNVAEQGGSILPPTTREGLAVFKSQMIRNASEYQNFSLLSVAIILILSTILILLGWTLDIIVGFFQRMGKRHHSRLSWVEDGYLQLQRMAYEGAGYQG
ncbi:hypothetical protein DL98DRAFT_536567 [Cadophora sp. DSE1049]|nr:hypothetical protein DL98DRAFT_536567 [Cadophora sp. DSE1049]